MDRIGDTRLGLDNRDIDIAIHIWARRRLGDDLQRDAGMFGAEIIDDTIYFIFLRIRRR